MMSFFNTKLLSSTLFLIMLLVFDSCTKDPCKENFCKNGGICFDGKCECPKGYTGKYCEIKVNTSAGSGTTPVNNNIVFWTDINCGFGKYVVNIDNNKTDTILTQVASIPSCNASGCAKFRLSEGRHYFHIETTGPTYNYYNGFIDINDSNACYAVNIDCYQHLQVTENGVLVPGGDLGPVSFYSSVSTNCNKYYVYIDENFTTLNDYTYLQSNGSTGCGYARYANFNLAINNTFAYTVRCNNNVVKTGFVTVTGNCNKVKID